LISFSSTFFLSSLISSFIKGSASEPSGEVMDSFFSFFSTFFSIFLTSSFFSEKSILHFNQSGIFSSFCLFSTILSSFLPSLISFLSTLTSSFFFSSTFFFFSTLISSTFSFLLSSLISSFIKGSASEPSGEVMDSFFFSFLTGGLIFLALDDSKLSFNQLGILSSSIFVILSRSSFEFFSGFSSTFFLSSLISSFIKGSTSESSGEVMDSFSSSLTSFFSSITLSSTTSSSLKISFWGVTSSTFSTGGLIIFLSDKTSFSHLFLLAVLLNIKSSNVSHDFLLDNLKYNQ